MDNEPSRGHDRLVGVRRLHADDDGDLPGLGRDRRHRQRRALRRHRGLVLKLDITGWGWIHLVIGILVFLAGLGIFSGNVLARTVGVLVAIGSAIANFVWLPIQPVWSSIMIAVAVAVIWALTAHGRDIAAEG